MSRFQEIVSSKVVCPKCKSNTLYLRELWKNHTITFWQGYGRFDRKDGNLESGGPYKVEAECASENCRHRWTVKGALQIDDVIKT